MNHYEFPLIRDLDQVLAVVEGVDGFSVTRKADYTVVNYHYNTPEVFPEVVDEATAIRRECRGLIFGLDGQLISRPYHKFFNVNENAFTQFGDLDFTDAEYFDKVDGSMITSIMVNDQVYFKTKRTCKQSHGYIKQVLIRFK